MGERQSQVAIGPRKAIGNSLGQRDLI